MQISAANLIAAQQAAQAALAAKQAVKAVPGFAAALPDLQAAPAKTVPTTPAATPQAGKPQGNARLGQHVDITV